MAKTGGYGIKVKITITATLTVIANLEDVDLPEMERLVAEATSHDSTGGYREYVSTGKRQVNSFTATLFWDRAQTTHAAIQTAFDSNVAVNMSVEDSAGKETIAFAAFITKIGRMGTQEDAYKAEVEIVVTGVPTITVAP